MRHCLLGELAVRLVHVGYESDTPRGEDAGSFHLPPFLEVAGDDFFDVVGGVDASDV